MTPDDQAPMRLRWARMRFSIISHLLTSPPEPGELAGRITELAAKSWRHPTKGSVIHLSPKTIERMYYAARAADDPVGVLARKVPKHAGTHPSITPEVAAAIEQQYRDHPRWTWQLHHDNLVALAKTEPALTPVPAYATVRRYMKAHGMSRRQKRRQGKAVDARSRRARRARTRSLRQRALALRLPRWQAAGRHRERGAEDAVPLRAARRLLAGVLPRAVVPRRREHREPGARLSQGIQKRGVPRGVQRSRRGDGRRRDHGRAGAAGHRAST